MSELNEEELLLLNNFLYVDSCTGYSSINDFINACRDDNGRISSEVISTMSIGGCMSAEDCTHVVQRMDKCSDNFKNLEISRSIDDGGIRGICFTDTDNNATIVFRGTGGTYDAWHDNVEGEYRSDTAMQRIADDFVKYNCASYTNITVSGHSKGGNLAQYVTVMNNDRVDRCISFDGQGFSKNFITAHPEINDISRKIKSISAHNDYVNILLTPIAGERVFVNNMGKSLVGRHSSFVLLRSCRFDENGNITNLTKQEHLTGELEKRVDNLAAVLDCLPNDGNEYNSNLIAAILASAMSSDKGEEYESNEIDNALSSVCEYTRNLLGFGDDGRDALVTDELYIDPRLLESAIDEYDLLVTNVRSCLERVNGVSRAIDYKALSRIGVDCSLKSVEDKLSICLDTIDNHRSLLKEIIGIYRNTEEGLVTLFSAGRSSM